MKRATEEALSRTPNEAFNYVFQSQGSTPNGEIRDVYVYLAILKPTLGKWNETSEGIESRFAVQVLSKFAILYYLTQKNAIKEAAISVCAPGGSTKDFDGTDPDLKKAKAADK